MGNKKGKDMNTVNFFVIEILETSNPEVLVDMIWLGRATITQETDYDDQDQPFLVDTADVTDVFLLRNPLAAAITATRVEIPSPSYEGQMFISRMKNAAITAYHNPKLQPAEMPNGL